MGTRSEYTPRRQSKRWLDGDCPEGVLAIYDHPKFADRYTVFYKEPVTGTTFADMWLSYRGMSPSPCSPQGMGCYGEMPASDLAAYRLHNKHRAAKWSALPEAVKALVRSDCTDDTTEED